MIAHDVDVQQINTNAKELTSIAKNPSLDQEVKQLNAKWSTTLKKLSEKQSLLTKLLQNIPPKSYTDSLAALTRWCDDFEANLMSRSFLVSEVQVMERKMSELEVLFSVV